MPVWKRKAKKEWDQTTAIIPWQCNYDAAQTESLDNWDDTADDRANDEKWGDSEWGSDDYNGKDDVKNGGSSLEPYNVIDPDNIDTSVDPDSHNGDINFELLFKFLQNAL